MKSVIKNNARIRVIGFLAKQGENLNDMTIAELRDLLRKNSLDLPSNNTLHSWVIELGFKLKPMAEGFGSRLYNAEQRIQKLEARFAEMETLILNMATSPDKSEKTRWLKLAEAQKGNLGQ